MIDPINNQAYQSYTNVTERKVNTAQGQEAFSLDYHDEGVIYEPDEKKKEADISADLPDTKKQNPQTAAGRDMLELSSATAAPADAKTQSEGTLMHTIRQVFQTIRDALQKTWAVIWEDPHTDKSTAAASDILDEMPADMAESPEDTTPVSADTGATTEDEVLKALKAKDASTFESLLTEDGAKHLARNTDLLTYYDRKGNLVNVDPSARQRILHGDHGTQKS